MTQPDLVDLFDRVLSQASPVVAGVTPDQLALPTPCAEWSVGDLLDHMVGTLRASVSFLEGRAAQHGGGGHASLIGDNPAATFDAAAAASLAAHRVPGALEREIDTPAGRMPAQMFLNFPLMDMWVHRWDLAQATGQTIADNDEITGYVAGFCNQAFGQQRPPAAVIGPEVAVAADAAPIDRLVGFLGRQP